MYHIVDGSKVSTSLYIYNSFTSLRGAKISLAAHKKKNPNTTLIIMSNETYKKLNVDVVVKNLLTGAPVKIRKSELGTCVDPSTERYWTM